MKFNKNLSTIHGYLCADGYVSTNLPHQKHKYYSIGLRNTNYTLLKDFQKNFQILFRVKPKLIKGQRCIKYSKGLYHKLMENGPFHSNNWKFPNLSKENSRYWLRSFFDCEAWIISNKRKTRSVCLESINRKQLPNIQKALKKFNINSKIYNRKNRKTSILTIPDKGSIINFEKEIGFLHPHKKKKLRKAIGSFVNYDWNISKENIKKIFKEKAKINKPYIVKILSIKKENLEKISKLISDLFGIESKIYKNKNGFGNIYYYLSVQKKEYVKKIISIGLLKTSYKNKIIKNLLK